MKETTHAQRSRKCLSIQERYYRRSSGVKNMSGYEYTLLTRSRLEIVKAAGGQWYLHFSERRYSIVRVLEHKLKLRARRTCLVSYYSIPLAPAPIVMPASVHRCGLRRLSRDIRVRFAWLALVAGYNTYHPIRANSVVAQNDGSATLAVGVARLRHNLLKL